MERQLYIKIDWPESQQILDWKKDLRDMCYSIEECGYMVPKGLWDEFNDNPDLFFETFEDKGMLMDFPRGEMTYKLIPSSTNDINEMGTDCQEWPKITI